MGKFIGAWGSERREGRMSNDAENYTISVLHSLTDIPLFLLSSEAMLFLFSRSLLNLPSFPSTYFDMVMF